MRFDCAARRTGPASAGVGVGVRFPTTVGFRDPTVTSGALTVTAAHSGGGGGR
jgi:hypothetical protein